MSDSTQRKQRRTIIGEVVSRSGAKSIKVAYFYKRPHALYKKEIKRKTVVHVHDDAEQANTGDTVEIMEIRPISKLKRFRLVKVLKQAPTVGA